MGGRVGDVVWTAREEGETRHAEEQPSVDVPEILLKEYKEINLEKSLFDPHTIPSSYSFNCSFNIIITYIIYYMLYVIIHYMYQILPCFKV